MTPQSKRRALLASAAVAALLGALRPAMSAPSADAELWMTLRFAQSTYGNEPLTRDEVEKRLMPMFEQADVDGNGVSQSDYDQAERIRNAQQRASQVTMILRDDLNGDGKVTRAEVTQARGHEARAMLTGGGGMRIAPTPAQSSDILKQITDRAMKADANGDGTIVLAEMLSHANDQIQRHSGSYNPERSIPMILDANSDGSVSRTEFKTLLNHVFDTTDTNRDGRISPDERAALTTKSGRLQQEESTARRAQMEADQARQRAAQCALPVAPKSAKLVVVSAYEGQALSTVALDGDDEEVTVSRIVVEPGREPLALALTSYAANIWLIEGDTKRVSSVVVSARTGNAVKTPRAGVVGVPKEKVVIAKSTDCLQQISSEARNAPESESGRFTGELGRKPDAIFAVYDLPTISLPSGSIDKQTAFPGSIAAPAGPAAGVWNVMLDFNPKGLVDIDPAKVVAAAKPTRYAVRPQEAGLAQLVQSGALEISGTARVVKLGGTQVMLGDGDDLIRGSIDQAVDARTVPVQYTIKSKISIPAGLSGAHSVKFVLPPGVPEPAGEPGHSRLVRAGR